LTSPNVLNISKYHKNKHKINKEQFSVTRVTILRETPNNLQLSSGKTYMQQFLYSQ